MSVSYAPGSEEALVGTAPISPPLLPTFRVWSFGVTEAHPTLKQPDARHTAMSSLNSHPKCPALWADCRHTAKNVLESCFLLALPKLACQLNPIALLSPCQASPDSALLPDWRLQGLATRSSSLGEIVRWFLLHSSFIAVQGLSSLLGAIASL